MTIHHVIADSEELSVLTKVLSRFCSSNGISEGSDRDDAAYRLMQIFRQGAKTEEALLAGLQKDTRASGSGLS